MKLSDRKRKYIKDESARSIARVVVIVVLWTGLGLAWWVWPAGVTDIPLQDAPSGTLAWAIGALLIALLTIAIVVKAWRDI